MTHARCVLRDGVALGFVPAFLKPILGPLIVWRGKKACEDCIKILVPIVEKRIEQFQRGKREGTPVAVSSNS
jgi:hypothetical protein